MQPATRQRTFWEAAATVLIPSIIIWTIAFCFVLPSPTLGELPYYLLFASPTPVLIIPVYYRYRTGHPLIDGTSRRSCVITGTTLSLCALAFSIELLRDHTLSWHFFVKLFITFASLSGAVSQIRRVKRNPVLQSLKARS